MTCIKLPAPAERCLLSMVNQGYYDDYCLYKNYRPTGRTVVNTIICPVPDIIHELNCIKALWMNDGDNAGYDSLKEYYINGINKINVMISQIQNSHHVYYLAKLERHAPEFTSIMPLDIRYHENCGRLYPRTDENNQVNSVAVEYDKYNIYTIQAFGLGLLHLRDTGNGRSYCPVGCIIGSVYQKSPVRVDDLATMIERYIRGGRSLYFDKLPEPLLEILNISDGDNRDEKC